MCREKGREGLGREGGLKWSISPFFFFSLLGISSSVSVCLSVCLVRARVNECVTLNRCLPACFSHPSNPLLLTGMHNLPRGRTTEQGTSKPRIARLLYLYLCCCCCCCCSIYKTVQRPLGRGGPRQKLILFVRPGFVRKEEKEKKKLKGVAI